MKYARIFGPKQCLCLFLVIGLSISSVVAQDEDDESSDVNETDQVEPPKTIQSSGVSGSSSRTDATRKNENSGSSGKVSKSKTGRLLQSIDKVKSRLEQSREILAEIIESFKGSGDPRDEEKLEDALSKYDEMIEDLEAEFTKTKIRIGLRLEENLKLYNETADKFVENFRDIDGDLVDWLKVKRARVTNDLRKGLFRLNDYLGMGVERLIAASDRGKDALIRLHKRRSEKKAKLTRLLKGRAKDETSSENTYRH